MCGRSRAIFRLHTIHVLHLLDCIVAVIFHQRWVFFADISVNLTCSRISRLKLNEINGFIEERHNPNLLHVKWSNFQTTYRVIFFLEIIRKVALRLENNSQDNWMKIE